MAKRRASGEGSLYKTKEGYWEARITIGYNEKGYQKYKVFSGKTQEVVKKKLRSYLSGEKDTEPENACNLTVAEWLDMWVEKYVANNVRVSTRTGYDSVIRCHLKPYIGYLKLKDIKKTDIEKLYTLLLKKGRADSRKGEPMSIKSIRNVHVCLHAALEEAYKCEYVNKNMASIAKVPTANNTDIKKEIEIFTREEQNRLIEKCPNNSYGIAIKLALATGMRLGEFTSLYWDDIDFENYTIRINKTLGRNKNFDPKIKSKTRLAIQTDTKTKGSKRIIKVTKAIMEMLEEHKKRQDEERIYWDNAYTHGNMVFARPDGGLIDPGTFRDKYLTVLDLAGVKKCTVHALRHTFATRALEAGVQAKVVSKILGHSTIQMTLDTYSHVLPDIQLEAMEMVEQYVSGGDRVRQ